MNKVYVKSFIFVAELAPSFYRPKGELWFGRSKSNQLYFAHNKIPATFASTESRHNFSFSQNNHPDEQTTAWWIVIEYVPFSSHSLIRVETEPKRFIASCFEFYSSIWVHFFLLSRRSHSSLVFLWIKILTTTSDRLDCGNECGIFITVPGIFAIFHFFLEMRPMSKQ